MVVTIVLGSTDQCNQKLRIDFSSFSPNNNDATPDFVCDTSLSHIEGGYLWDWAWWNLTLIHCIYRTSNRMVTETSLWRVFLSLHQYSSYVAYEFWADVSGHNTTAIRMEVLAVLRENEVARDSLHD
jgi:hypothetical protein